jgi:hypothetical protein
MSGRVLTPRELEVARDLGKTGAQRIGKTVVDLLALTDYPEQDLVIAQQAGACLIGITAGILRNLATQRGEIVSDMEAITLARVLLGGLEASEP